MPANVSRIVMLLAAIVLVVPARADEKKPIALPTGYLTTPDWLKASTEPLAAGEIDRLVDGALKYVGIQPAPLIGDEQFIRRVYLDVTGRLPVPADVSDFLKDTAANKRARLVGRLLGSDEYAEHWASYWREVITSRTTDQRTQLFARSFELWLQGEFKKNRNWGAMVRNMLTATGDMRQDEPDKNGQAFFLGSRFGADATTERAAETARIFLGIQIQCAQCHDHPSDVWKREQFHELAAYFARVKERPIRDGMRLVGQQLVSLPFGEHQMPGKDDPKKTTAMMPRFLDGKEVDGFPTDLNRRQSLAEVVTSKKDPWFAGAFVNRMWGHFMGQAFYQPVDDMGPQKEAMLPDVLARIAGSFRGTDYDIRQLLQAMLTSQTYQRQVRPGEAPEDHLLFAASNPTRLTSDALWNSLIGTLGAVQQATPFGGFAAAAGGPLARFRSFEFVFKQEFAYDPSAKAEEVEGSVSQALLMMNNPLIHQKLKAQGSNLLARILTSYTTDDEALRMVYLRALARRPTDRELSRCKEFIRRTGDRNEAYEDILWALINSTEFQTRR